MPYPKNVEQLFIEHEGLLRNDVAKSIQSADFFIKNITKDSWVDNQGEQYSYPIYERTLPTSPVTFTSWVSSAGDGSLTTNDGTAGGASDLPGQNIDSFGVTTRQVSLKRGALNSPDIHLEDLRFAWQVEDQVKNVTRVLSENTKYVWQNAYLDEYVGACGNKIVLTPALPTGSASFPLTQPTSVLTWGVLEETHERLGYVGGDINPFMRSEDDEAVYALVGDRFTFQDLKMADANVRGDIRAAYQGSEGAAPTLGNIGLGSKTYRGYKFFTIQNPPRYDFVAGQWVRREPYAPQSATRGQRWEITDAYRNAQFTDTMVFHKDVMKILIPRPITERGGMSRANPTYDWAGTFVWRNIPDRDGNVDGNVGFFRALYAYGPKVERPDLGFVIRHRRCARALDLRACY